VLALYRFVGSYRWAVAVIVLLGLLSSAFEGIGLGLMIPFLGLVLDSGPASGGGMVVRLLTKYGINLEPSSRLLLIGGTMVALVLLKSIIAYTNARLTAWLNGTITCRIRTAAFDQLLDVSYEYIIRRDPGQLHMILDTEVRRVGNAFSHSYNFIVSACATLVFLTILFMISWQITLTFGVSIIVGSLVIQRISRKARHYGRELTAAHKLLAERLTDALATMRMVRAFGQEDRERKRFNELATRVKREFVRSESVSSTVIPAMEVVYLPLFVCAVIVAWYAGVGVPTLFTCLLLLYRLQPHIKRLDQTRVQFNTVLGSVEAVANLLDRSDKPYLVSGSTKFLELKRGVELRAVSFEYSGSAGQQALRDVSFSIQVGSVTAIVGTSGAGKSTLVNLLFRLYDPTRGQILVDGTDLSELDVRDWRRRLAIAGQDAELMTGTIADNISYGRPETSESEIRMAAELANAAEFIEELPEGYRTRVGTRGLRLSGGQRQRVGLARALLCQPDLLILDEATNSLDGLSESAVQKALDELRGSTTILVIAHRLSTIRNADHVVVLSEGRVVEQGRPDTLTSAKGVFSKLYELQLHGTGTSG
jgi:ATP-binding cassette, subfamily B, bacterial MsbA